MKFQSGDRFVLTEEGQAIWPDHTCGVIVKGHSGSGGAGAYDKDSDSYDQEWYEIRMDGYDYRLDVSPSNCHTAASRILARDEPTDQEIADAIRSIQEAT